MPPVARTATIRRYRQPLAVATDMLDGDGPSELGVMPDSGTQMNQLKRFTVCMLMNHKWVKTRYPLGSDGEAGGLFVRWRRCGKEPRHRK